MKNMTRKFITFFVAVIAVAGVTACDPAPPHAGCEFVAAGEAYRGDENPGGYSVPWMEDVVKSFQDLGYTVDYDGATNAWTSNFGGHYLIGYSVEEDEHVWSCPV